MFVFSAVHFASYLVGLSNMMLIWAAGARFKWRAHLHNRMPRQRFKPQTSESIDKHSTTDLPCIRRLQCFSTLVSLCSSITYLCSANKTISVHWMTFIRKLTLFFFHSERQVSRNTVACSSLPVSRKNNYDRMIFLVPPLDLKPWSVG